MLKLAAVFLATMLVVISAKTLPGIPVGGYQDRPELLTDSNVKALTSFAAEHLALTQNLVLNHLTVTRVQTQLVAGLNYKIDFTAEPVNGSDTKLKSCHTLIYVRFDGTKKIIEANCN